MANELPCPGQRLLQERRVRNRRATSRIYFSVTGVGRAQIGSYKTSPVATNERITTRSCFLFLGHFRGLPHRPDPLPRHVFQYSLAHCCQAYRSTRAAAANNEQWHSPRARSHASTRSRQLRADIDVFVTFFILEIYSSMQAAYLIICWYYTAHRVSQSQATSMCIEPRVCFYKHYNAWILLCFLLLHIPNEFWSCSCF